MIEKGKDIGWCQTLTQIAGRPVRTAVEVPLRKLWEKQRAIKGIPLINMAVAQKNGTKMEPWQVETWTKT